MSGNNLVVENNGDVAVFVPVIALQESPLRLDYRRARREGDAYQTKANEVHRDPRTSDVRARRRKAILRNSTPWPDDAKVRLFERVKIPEEEFEEALQKAYAEGEEQQSLRKSVLANRGSHR